MALQVNDVLIRHGLHVHVLTYVKEGANLFTMISSLTSVVSCEFMGLYVPFIRACRDRTMSKCCQYAIDDLKVYDGLTSISIKEM
jgi:hypothetical protein